MKNNYEAILHVCFAALEITEYDPETDGENENTVDDERWTCTTAAAQLLQNVAQIIGDTVWDRSINLVMSKLNNEGNWLDQYIGMTCLGSVLVGPNVDFLE